MCLLLFIIKNRNVFINETNPQSIFRSRFVNKLQKYHQSQLKKTLQHDF